MFACTSSGTKRGRNPEPELDRGRVSRRATSSAVKYQQPRTPHQLAKSAYVMAIPLQHVIVRVPPYPRALNTWQQPPTPFPYPQHELGYNYPYSKLSGGALALGVASAPRYRFLSLPRSEQAREQIKALFFLNYRYERGERVTRRRKEDGVRSRRQPKASAQAEEPLPLAKHATYEKTEIASEQNGPSIFLFSYLGSPLIQVASPLPQPKATTRRARVPRSQKQRLPSLLSNSFCSRLGQHLDNSRKCRTGVQTDYSDRDACTSIRECTRVCWLQNA